MTEEQWREQVDAQASGTDQVPQASETENTDTRTALQKVRDQEGREIQSRLQKRWHDQKQRTAETEQTEGEAEGGSKQYPPTHPDYEKSKNPQATAVSENQARKVSREIQNLGSRISLRKDQ